MKFAFSTLLIVSVTAVAIAADGPSIEVRIDPQRLGVEDLTRLTIRVIEPGEDRPAAELGNLTNFEIVQGPSMETQFSWVNGRSSSSVNLSWILRPLAVGAASVGPAIKVRIGKKTLTAGAVTAEIVPGTVQPRRQRRPSSLGRADPFERVFGAQRRPTRQAKVGIGQILSRSQVFEGQPVVATIVLDSNGGAIDGFEWTRSPEHPGWWVQPVEMPSRPEGEIVEVDGEAFNRFTLSRFVLMPLKPGVTTIPEAVARIGMRGRSLFTPSSVVERSTKTLKVEVAPRPAPPKGYSGAVGDLKYSATVEPSVIAFGSSAVMSIKLKGNGNLPLVQAPVAWPSSEDCSTYPPEEESDFKVGADGIKGSRTWRTTVVPRQSGELVLEPVELAVFDPRSGAYKYTTLGPFQLTVEAPPPTPTPSPLPWDEAKAVEGNGVSQLAELPGSIGQATQAPSTWLLVGLALVVGVLGGGGTAWIVARRRAAFIPPKRAGETPAERARRLQAALEKWWMDLPDDARVGDREDEVKSIRKALESVRFAPGRADHTETVQDLENRMRLLAR